MFDADFIATSINLPGSQRQYCVEIAGTARLANGWRPEEVEVFGRVENLLDRRYSEVFSFAAAGRAGYGGDRLRF